MGFAIQILFVIFGSAYYILRYSIESGIDAADKQLWEEERKKKYEEERPIREKQEREWQFADALKDYLSDLNN